MSHATVIITTKNRKEDLAKAVTSALEQTAQPKVLVIDDGSNDGTEQLIKQRFPSVTVHRSNTSRGLIFQRNHAAHLATTPFLFSIDDDAVFSSPGIVEATLEEFDHPRVGAVGIPFVDVNTSPLVRQQAPNSQSVYATYSYIGTAHALRRDLFISLSGYRASLCHQGEEEDYCIRMLNAGYVTRCGNSDPIHHFESPRRSLTRMDYYGARNKILYAWHNVPFPYLPAHFTVTAVKSLLYSLGPNRFWNRFRGVLAAFFLCATNRVARQPVTASVYQLSRLLKRSGAMPLGKVEALLPEIEAQKPNDLFGDSVPA